MSTEIKLFEGNQIRFIPTEDNDSFYVVGNDVLKALEYPTSSRPARVFASIPDEWKGVKPIHTPGGTQQMLCLSEQGLYFFLGRSDKPKAIPYQRWIAGEVVPSIRKTGSYAITNLPQLEELTSLVKTIALENKEIKEQIQEMAPKVRFYNAVSETDKVYDMNEVAKSINKCGRNQLFKLLRSKNILMKNNLPYQRYVNLGLFKTILDKNNLFVKTVVTGKGLQFIEDILS